MNLKVIILLFIVVCTGFSCSRNAMTGRSQLSLVSDAQLQQMSLTQYKQFLSESKVVPTSNDNTEMVKRVGQRLAAGLSQYYQQKGINNNDLASYKWEFNLVENKEVNAWCMPGGKVVVYTGILPVTQNENALAVVLGHEIIHAIGQHGKERMSQEMVAQGLQVAGNVALGSNPQALNIFNSVYAPGAQVGVLLPNSRNQELEADHYGLILAAISGYDPQEAIAFWTRMSKLSAGNTTPVFLRTHPADAERIEKLKKLMPEALQYYKPAPSTTPKNTPKK